MLPPNYIKIHILFLAVLSFFLASPCSMRVLSSQPGIEYVPPALEVWRLNHWTAREVPSDVLFFELGSVVICECFIVRLKVYICIPYHVLCMKYFRIF